MTVLTVAVVILAALSLWTTLTPKLSSRIPTRDRIAERLSRTC